MSKYISEKYRNYQAYTPGEQPEGEELIKLNTNESPFPPGIKVLQAIGKSDLADLRLYPSPTQRRIREALSCEYGLDASNYCVSNGSDDILNYAFSAFCDKDRPAVFPDITYGFYRVFSDYYGIESIEIPLNEDFTVNVDDYLGLRGAGSGGTSPGLIVLANPNAPTGIALEIEDIERIVKANPDSVVLVDEAYVDFGGNSALSLIDRYENLIVARTFSKSSSLAGARLGFCAANSELIEDLELIKYSTNPYSVNRMTELVGLAVLDEPEYYMNNSRKIIESREWTKGELADLGFEFTDSKANFLFIKSGPGCYEFLREKGILVRYFDLDRTKEYIRVTVGTQEEMEVFVKGMREWKETK